MDLDSVFFTIPYLWLSALALLCLEIALLWVRERHGYVKLVLLVLYDLWFTLAWLNGVTLLECGFVAMVLLLPLLIYFIRSTRA